MVDKTVLLPHQSVKTTLRSAVAWETGAPVAYKPVHSHILHWIPFSSVTLLALPKNPVFFLNKLYGLGLLSQEFTVGERFDLKYFFNFSKNISIQFQITH